MENKDKLRYSFKWYAVNGLGADLIRIFKLINYCDENNIDLYFDKNDNWAIVPNNENNENNESNEITEKNWKGFFNSGNLTEDETITIVDRTVLNKVNENVPFDKLKNICNTYFIPNEKYNVIYNIKQPYAVLHVRRGDKVSGPWKEGVKHELDEYYNKISEKYLPSQVFVMSDSPEVMQEAQQKGFMVDKDEIRRDGFVYKHYCKKYSNEELEDEAHTFFKNMYIFKHAELLVGSNSSYFYMLGQLINGKKGINLSDNLRYNCYL